jgi:hypothetical protein
VGIDAVVARRAEAALDALSDLAPTGGRRTDISSVPTDWFRWLDTGLHLFTGPVMSDPVSSLQNPAVAFLKEAVLKEPAPMHPLITLDREYGERLAAVQQLREGRHSVRVGWLWVAGSSSSRKADGVEVRRRVFQPLVTRTARVLQSSHGWRLATYGDTEITSLVTDREIANRLEDRIEFGGGAFSSPNDLSPALLGRLPRLRSFAIDCAAAAGLPTADFELDRLQPEEHMRVDGLRIVVGIGVYTTDEVSRTSRASTLRAWTSVPVEEPTAFHVVYAGAEPTQDPEPTRIESPVPLTARQLEVVRRARSAPLTVVSGAPGTGKSHTLVAVVCDALAHGRSVLVAAKDDAAVEALTTLLGRQPGLVPIVFGSSEHRERLALRLANGGLAPCEHAQLRAARASLDEAIAERDVARAVAGSSLAAAWLLTPEGRGAHRKRLAIAPNAASLDTVALDDLLARTRSTGGGPFGSWRRRRAERTLRRTVGSDDDVPLDELVAAISSVHLAASRDGAPLPADACAALDRAEAHVRACLTAWLALDTRSPDRLDRRGLAAVATLATALRSGRNARRAQLERLRDRTLSQALPLWMGTLADVEDLLPAVPGLFDLVLVDEASSTEQSLAAPALLRGRRAVIVGDPRQLRHVSFVSDATIEDTMSRHGIDLAHRAQLDVRRNSLYDAAAAAGPVLQLDEHFRSAPHLIDVVARTLYGGALQVATRTPLTHSWDCVHLTEVRGSRRNDGVVDAEVTEIVAALRRFRDTDGSVGVISPFRAQADAIEAAVLRAFDAATLVRLGLRIGTVHSFQGNERHTVLCSLGVSEGDSAAWRFVDDPHLLAVMLTRARSSMTIVASATPPPTSLLAQYVAAADTPPGPPAPAHPPDGWTRSIADDLRLAGVDVWESYPTGRHVVDLATIRDGRPVAIVCRLHDGGPDAHIDRHLSLMHAGWTVVDALEAAWSDDVARHVVDLVHWLQLGSAPGS